MGTFANSEDPDEMQHNDNEMQNKDYNTLSQTEIHHN